MEKEPTPQQILDLKALVKDKAWLTYVSFVEDEIKASMEMMFENQGLSEKDRDALVNRRNNLKYAIEMPANIIEKARPPKKQKEINNEAYD